jgi:hypothetical protein
MPSPRIPDLKRLSPFQAGRLAAFDTLPADAIVDDIVAAVVLGISVETLKRSDAVPRRDISQRTHGRRVGDIRDKIRGISNGKSNSTSSGAAA